MTFQESIRVCFSKYAEFSGRASRSEYWWFALFIFLGYLVTSLINDVLGGIFALGVLLPSIAVATRRLHDTNRSGWLQLIVLVPVIGSIVLLVFLIQDSKSENSYAQV